MGTFEVGKIYKKITGTIIVRVISLKPPAETDRLICTTILGRWRDRDENGHREGIEEPWTTNQTFYDNYIEISEEELLIYKMAH
jgi:hypothetical protein